MFFEATILFAAFLSVVLSANIARAFGKGIMGAPFYFFSVSIFILGLSLLFLFLGDSQIFLHLEDVNMHIWVHVLVVLGLLLFAIGGKKLKDIARDPVANATLRGSEKLLLFASVLFSFVIFFISMPLDASLAPITVNSIIDRWGLHHFIAFIFAVVCAVYVWSLRSSWGKMLSVGVAPFLCFLFLVGVQHLWETVTESWKLFPISSESIESVEQFLLLPAYVMLCIAFFRIRSFIK